MDKKIRIIISVISVISVAVIGAGLSGIVVGSLNSVEPVSASEQVSQITYRGETAVSSKQGEITCDWNCEHEYLMNERVKLARNAALKRAREKAAAEKAEQERIVTEQAAEKAAAEKAAQEKKVAEQAKAVAANNQAAQSSQSSAPVAQSNPAPAVHWTARDCNAHSMSTTPCQGTIDTGGFVQVFTYKVEPGTEALYGITDNTLTWFMGHNTTESWILDVNIGNTVTVNGRNYRAVAIKDAVQGQSYVEDGFWANHDYMLQTCYWNSNTMKQVSLEAI